MPVNMKGTYMWRFVMVASTVVVLVLTLMQRESRADEIEEGTIRVSPKKVMLGSLEYGDRDSTALLREVKIEGLSPAEPLKAIDLSHAPGIRVLNRRDAGEVTTLQFGINVAEFIRGEPYGNVIRRPIRLETTSLDQPQILLPVIGWTSVNKTSRNFNEYLYAGHERWQGIWGTPNIAGSMLAPLVLLLLGGAAALFPTQISSRRWFKISVSVTLFGLVGILFALLAATYSRGAWTAFIAGSLVLVLFSGQIRRFVFCGLLVFVLLVFLLPSGLKRLDSSTQLQEDPSVSHRLELWLGALQMMGDHNEGVGAGQFGAIFERDYQRFDHVALNSTAVSDYFTVGSEHGVLLLSVIVGSLLLVLFLSWRDACARDNTGQLILTASLLSIMVASGFSTLWFVLDYQLLFGFVVAGLLMCLFNQAHRDGKRRLKRALVLEAIFVFGCILSLEISSLLSLLLQPTRSSNVAVADPNGHLLRVHRIDPRWHKSKGIIVYFPEDQESLSLLCHSTLRPLATLGWQVLISNGMSEHKPDIAVLMAAASLRPPVFVAGEKEGGRTAWLTVTHSSKQSVRAGAGLDFLTMDLDPARGGPTFQTPFLVFHFLYDDAVSANATICASRRTAFSNLPLTVQICPEQPAAFSVGTTQWVEALDRYFSAKAAL